MKKICERIAPIYVKNIDDNEVTGTSLDGYTWNNTIKDLCQNLPDFFVTVFFGAREIERFINGKL